MASLLSSQSSSNDGPHPSIASRRRPRPSSKHPPLFKMSIFELRKFVEEEKKRSLHFDKKRTNRNRHMLLPGEFFHEDLAIKNLGTSGRGVVSVANDLIRLGTILVQAEGIKCQSIETIDIFSTLFSDLCCAKRDRRRRAEHFLKYAKNFCPESPITEELKSQWADQRVELEKLLRIYPNSFLKVDDLLELMIKFDRNGFVAGIFPLAAYFNHSCRPNCAHHYNQRTRMYEIRTIEDIAPGTELNICYLAETRWHLPTDQRRKLLMDKYYFHCMCRRCNRQSIECTKKILGAEMALECMRCQFKDCKSMGDTKNYCFAIDDHQGKDLPGYSPCTNCKRENDAALLDKLFLKVYYDINNALTLDREACEKLLVELYDKAKHWLHPSHWLLYKLSDCLQFVSKELAIQTRNNRFSIHGAHIQIHKQHALLLLNGIHVFHENENLTCVIKERAANALRTYVDKFYVKLKEEDELLKYQIQMKNKLLDKANELEREAISVQRNIRGLL